MRFRPGKAPLEATIGETASSPASRASPADLCTETFCTVTITMWTGSLGSICARLGAPPTPSGRYVLQLTSRSAVTEDERAKRP
jgi:hypothetical protein